MAQGSHDGRYERQQGEIILNSKDNKCMQKIMFNDMYGLTKAVLEGRKTQTRRIAGYCDSPDITAKDVSLYKGDFGSCFCHLKKVIHKEAAFRIGHNIAVAQPYKDVFDFTSETSDEMVLLKRSCLRSFKAYNNKMFVFASKMPHRIRITDIRFERLQDISDNDCLAEGIQKYPDVHSHMWGFSYIRRGALSFELSTTPREAYAKMIDKICGKGTWEKNPFVFVYEFRLVK